VGIGLNGDQRLEAENGTENAIAVRPRFESQHYFLFCFDTGSYYVAEAGLEFVSLLPQPPQCWVYRCALTHVATSHYAF
jgi:hypothetical protein